MIGRREEKDDYLITLTFSIHFGNLKRLRSGHTKQGKAHKQRLRKKKVVLTLTISLDKEDGCVSMGGSLHLSS